MLMMKKVISMVMMRMAVMMIQDVMMMKKVKMSVMMMVMVRMTVMIIEKLKMKMSVMMMMEKSRMSMMMMSMLLHLLPLVRLCEVNRSPDDPQKRGQAKGHVQGDKHL